VWAAQRMWKWKERLKEEQNAELLQISSRIDEGKKKKMVFRIYFLSSWTLI
jgi:hypothetical protein